jgi:hypothetical protein
MRKVRKINKGEEGWDVIFNNQKEILNASGKSKMNPGDVNTIEKGMNKIFRRLRAMLKLLTLTLLTN